MNKHRIIPLLSILGLATLSACGSEGRLSTIAGTVTVDGAPVESGAISFQSKTSPGASGGAVVTGGTFKIVDDDQFTPGEYAVVLQADRKTGRTIKDPQKGNVAETAPIALKDSPQTVTIGSDNAESLSLNYTAAAK